MRTKHLLLFAAVLFTGGFTAINSVFTDQSKMAMPDDIITENSDNDVRKISNGNKNYELDVNDLQSIRTELQTALDNQDPANQSLEWYRIGPNNVAGRMRAILMDKDDPTVLYAGGAAGGIFKSETNGQYWEPVETDYTQSVLSVTSLAQSDNGTIFYSTGDFFDKPMISKEEIPAFAGGGIFMKKEGDDTFSQIEATEPVINSAFFGATQLDILDNNTIYVSTWKGLFLLTTTDGTSWSVEKVEEVDGYASDVKINEDGDIVVAAGGHVYQKSAGDDSFQIVSGSGENDIIAGGLRYEFDFAPSNQQFVYSIVSDSAGKLTGVFRSKDAGKNWEAISVSGSDDFQVVKRDYIYRGEEFEEHTGKYAMTITVDNNDPNYVYVAGTNLWGGYKVEGNTQFQWNQKTYNNVAKQSRLYLTTHIHQVIHHPENDISYIACDGGIYRYHPVDGTVALNTYLTTGQFYDVSYGPEGEILTGAQDNGVFYNRFQKPGSQFLYGDELLWGQDFFRNLKNGFQTRISQLSPRKIFFNHGNSFLRQSPVRGQDGVISGFYSSDITASHGDSSLLVKRNNMMAYWETNHYEYSQDTNSFKNYKEYEDTTIILESINIHGAPIEYEIDYLGIDTTVYFYDPYKSYFALGVNGNVWITTQATSKEPIARGQWLRALYPSKFYRKQNIETDFVSTTDLITRCQALTISKNGNNMYAAIKVRDSASTYIDLIRFDSLHNVADNDFYESVGGNIQPKDTLYNFMHHIGRIADTTVSSLVLDPNYPSRLVLTIADYNNTDHVYYCDSANTVTTSDFENNFRSIQGDLPSIPVFDGCINVRNDTAPNQLILGTEIGVWVTNDFTAADPTWHFENRTGSVNGNSTGEVGAAPVMTVKQQTHNMQDYPLVNNYGVIYIATFGKGLYVDSTYHVAPANASKEEKKTSFKASSGIDVSTYPNPVKHDLKVNFNLSVQGNVQMSIYNLSGKVLYNENVGSFTEGQHTHTISTQGLQSGIYFVNIQSAGDSQVVKIIKE